MAEITDEQVEAAAFELYAGGPWGRFVKFTDGGASVVTDAHTMETYRQMVRTVATALHWMDGREEENA